MNSSIALALAAACYLRFQGAHATPLPGQPSRVVVRAAEPSTYPLGDSCGGKSKYLNFNPDDAPDMGHLQQLHNVVCGDELNMLLIQAIDAVQNTNAVYERYFPNDDDNDKIFTGGLAPLIESFTVDNNDFNNVCLNANSNPENLAYTDIDNTDGGDGLEKHQIDTLARIALHEMTHYSSVGPASGVGTQIVDAINADGYFAYDPDKIHGLLAQDNEPGRCEINADSYAWMASDAYFSYACTTDPTNYAAYFQDAPAYEADERSDDGDSNNEPASDSDNPDSGGNSG